MGVTIFFLLISACVTLLVRCQIQREYISIDCGARDGFSFTDMITGIRYSSDQGVVESGVIRNVSWEYNYPQVPDLPQPLSDLRSFPEGNKSCYTLRPGNGTLNLIRAMFLYGNYDNQSSPPTFDLYVDVNFWTSVRFRGAGDQVIKEIITASSSDTLYVCLMNTNQGTPFISGLELRPLNGSIYVSDLPSSGSLVLHERLNIGSYDTRTRYRDDTYDRIWVPLITSSWIAINTSSSVATSGDGYVAPQEVLITAARPGRINGSLELSWNVTEPDSEFFVYMYFSEFDSLSRNESRKMDVTWNGSPLLTGFSPEYLLSSTFSNSEPMRGSNHTITISRSTGATLPPILNAIEVYVFRQEVENLTNNDDVLAVLGIKGAYGIGAEWSGDPCGPLNYSFKGVQCRFNGSSRPRIVSLNMSSSGLSGGIAPSVGDLSVLSTLDLSNNGLTGAIPGSLAFLEDLKYLNLKGNNLSGSIPRALIERSEQGSLSLMADDRNLCGEASCGGGKGGRNIIVPLSVSIAILFVLVLITAWVLKQRRLGVFMVGGRLLAGKRAPFSYKQIVGITKNFETVIGRGGYGTVYHGTLADGTPVAVKVLSSASPHGPRHFQTEVEVLMRIHHKNLTSFLGYCDSRKFCLVYEYMPHGNVKTFLSSPSRTPPSWERRLRIAADAAEGLLYLHHDCKPGIVHRDIKTENILLGEKLVAKLADFGLSRIFPDDDGVTHVSTAVMGTRGYLDPEYFISERLTDKSDVYSFGVVLLELLTGKPAIVRDPDQIHITAWISRLLDHDDITAILDPRLGSGFDPASVRRFLDVASACTVPSSANRVSMDAVVSELMECLSLELQSATATATTVTVSDIFSTDDSIQ